MVFFRKIKKDNDRAIIAQAAAASANNLSPLRNWQPPSPNYVELGTIQYVNLTADGRHGEYQSAVDIAIQTGKPIFANFVEWSG